MPGRWPAPTPGLLPPAGLAQGAGAPTSPRVLARLGRPGRRAAGAARSRRGARAAGPAGSRAPGAAARSTAARAIAPSPPTQAATWCRHACSTAAASAARTRHGHGPCTEPSRRVAAGSSRSAASARRARRAQWHRRTGAARADPLGRQDEAPMPPRRRQASAARSCGPGPSRSRSIGVQPVEHARSTSHAISPSRQGMSASPSATSATTAAVEGPATPLAPVEQRAPGGHGPSAAHAASGLATSTARGDPQAPPRLGGDQPLHGAARPQRRPAQGDVLGHARARRRGRAARRPRAGSTARSRSASSGARRGPRRRRRRRCRPARAARRGRASSGLAGVGVVLVADDDDRGGAVAHAAAP